MPFVLEVLDFCFCNLFMLKLRVSNISQVLMSNRYDENFNSLADLIRTFREYEFGSYWFGDDFAGPFVLCRLEY
jgi:hypothetical protein